MVVRSEQLIWRKGLKKMSEKGSKKEESRLRNVIMVKKSRGGSIRLRTLRPRYRVQ